MIGDVPVILVISDSVIAKRGLLNLAATTI
jgi:hypothetical protein